MYYKPLPRSFYECNTHEVAKKLLGKLLVRRWHNTQLVGRITEVESYLGLNDAASHAYRGQTQRNKIMWGDAGYTYVYLIYGMYDCLNVVTEKKNFPAAVLIRALEPLEGLLRMQNLRHTKTLTNLTTGPGKLTQALDITRKLHAEDLVTSQQLFIAEDSYDAPKKHIGTSTRIGVDYAGKDATLPWRYYLNNTKYISKHPKAIQNV